MSRTKYIKTVRNDKNYKMYYSYKGQEKVFIFTESDIPCYYGTVLPYFGFTTDEVKQAIKDTENK